MSITVFVIKSPENDNRNIIPIAQLACCYHYHQKKELTPNLTRRAQCANWLIFYREELFGYTVEELRERRQRKKEAEELAKQKEGRGDEWSPPVREVY